MERRVRNVLTAIVVLMAVGKMANAQPTMLKTVPDNSTNFVEAGDLVYFTAGDALWRTDGTAEGTLQLASGPMQAQWHLTNYGRYYNGYFYFVNGGTQLWRSDGTPSGTILLKTYSGTNLRILDATGGYLFFAASDAATGEEIHRTDGTAAGTILLRDINPGTASGFRGGSGVIGNNLLFIASDGVHGAELWKTDGTSSGTAMLMDINPGASDGAATTTNYFLFDGKFYFKGNTTDFGEEPWVSDGTEEGTYMLIDAEEGTPGSGNIRYEIAHDGNLYFLIHTGTGETVAHLWKTAGTTASTSRIQTIGSVDSYHNYHSFLAFNDKIYFWDRTDYFGDNLWVSDGTTAGTYTFYDLITMDGGISFFQVIKNHLVFTGSTQGIPFGLYRSDGTTEGTEQFADFKAQGYIIFPRDLTKVGDLLYYGDHDGLSSFEAGMPYSTEDFFHLFESDADTTRSMRTLWGINTIGTDNITNLNGKVIFTTYNNQENLVDYKTNLWIYDPAIRPEPEPAFTLVQPGGDKDVRRLIDSSVVRLPYDIPINIRFIPVESPGSVVFSLNNSVFRIENDAPYALAGDVQGEYNEWEGADAGTYTLTATSYSQPGGQGTVLESLTIRFTIPCELGDEDCIFTGEMLHEKWNNVSGTTVPAIPVERRADRITHILKFEIPENSGNNYGTRVRGFVVPPATGEYTFWIASNDHSELWLSTDDNPDNKSRIANLTRATNSREWNKFPSQKSAPVTLTAGVRYYIEALHKEGVGSDHLAVGWQLPDGTMERPIPGIRLSPFIPGTNTFPTVTLTHPADMQTFTGPADIRIEADARDGDDGTITKVEFLAGPDRQSMAKIFEDTEAPYYFIWEDVPAGNYVIVAQAWDEENNSNQSAAIHVTVNVGTNCVASGTITREQWSGVPGAAVSGIPVDAPPTSTSELTIFEGPTNIGVNYGSRIRGYICPPVTGGYNFWISSNDHSELWLSTDDNPSNKRRIAYLERATGPREWNKFATQLSGTIWLTEGQTYYIEALHKQGVGGDHVAVGWQLPDGTMERPIPGSRLSPFVSETLFASNSSTPGSSLYSAISIYPNPADRHQPELTISGYQGIQQPVQTEIRIINMTGETVFSNKIDCGGECGSSVLKVEEDLPPGLYFVNMNTNGIQHSKRLLVK